MTDKEMMLLLYRIMARTRALVEVLILHRQDIFGAFLTGLGQEAVSAGVMAAFLTRGILCDSPKSGDHRTQWGIATALDEITLASGHNHAFEIMKNHLCKATSTNKGRDGNIHWGCTECKLLPFLCSDMGRLPPLLWGMSEEMARQVSWRSLSEHERPVGVSFFGEGADQQGCIAEMHSGIAASNCVRYPNELEPYAGFYDPILAKYRVLRGAPCFEVVVQNHFSIYTDTADEHGRSDLARRVEGYGNMIGVTVDGDDVWAMYCAAQRAIANAQRFVSMRIVADTYRRTGHNEDMIQRDPLTMKEAREEFGRGNWEYEPDWSRGKILGVQPEEFKTQWEGEPLKRFAEYCIKKGFVIADEFRNIMRQAREEMWNLYERAKAEPDIDPVENKKDTSLFPPYPTSWSMPLEKPEKITATKKFTYYGAYVKVVGELLGNDDRTSFFGQDVRTGGVLAPTRHLAEKFGPLRVFNTPIIEEATHSNMAGRALMGGRPIAEVQQFAPFGADAFASRIAVVANNWYQKRVKFSYVDVFHSGVVRSAGSGTYHEEWPERFLVPMQGIMVVAPANAYDLVGLMRSAHEFDGPVAMLLQISAGFDLQFSSDIPVDPYCVPLGKAAVKCEGKDITVVTYGAACVRAALNEAEELVKENVSVEVIDLRTVWPFDLPTLRASIKKTGRFIVFHEDREIAGVGQTLVAELLKGKESILPYLDMLSVEVVASDNIPASTNHALAWDRLPYEVVDVEGKDEEDRTIKVMRHRSPKLAREIKKNMGCEEKQDAR